MAAEIVRQEIRAGHRDEYIVLMDDYGVEKHLSIPVTASAEQRSEKLSAAIAAHTASQAQMEAYATAAGLALTEQKTAGVAKRIKTQQANGIKTA